MRLVLLTGFMGANSDWDTFIGCFRETAMAKSFLPHVACAPYRELPADEPFVLCGYSMGGRVAISRADHPHCRGVISVSSSPGIRNPRERLARAEADERLARRIEALRGEEEFRAFLAEWWAQPVFQGTALGPEARESLAASRVSMDSRKLAAHLREFGPATMPSLWERWENLSIPHLAIAGANDPKYAAFAREMGEHTIIPCCGHQIPLEQPFQLAEAITTFLSRHFG